MLLVFAIAYGFASRRANKFASKKTRVWMLYMSVAALVAFGPVLSLLYLDVRAQVETTRLKQQFEHDRVASEAWKNGLRFSSGSVHKELDQAVATMPTRYIVHYGAEVIEAPTDAARSDLKGSIVEQLKRPNVAWTSGDLDAFTGMADVDDTGIRVLATWARDRTQLAAAAAMCSQATLTRSQSDDCIQTLRAAVVIWCQTDGAGCVELAKDEPSRKIIRSAGIILGK